MRRVRLPFALLVVALAGCDSTGPLGPTIQDLATADADCNQFPEKCDGCRDDSHCAGKADTPRCDVVTRACVPCLPANDNCPAGQVCTNRNNTWLCDTICKSNNDCAKLGGGSLCCAEHCVNPGMDVTNCGACGMVCQPVPNGSPACSSGHCIIGSCNAGFDDCDKAQVNGCEAVISNDPSNCGKCGNACKPFSNGLPTCTNGVCAAVCAPGFADCDNNTANGCEADTSFDIGHCGGCGRVCPAPANGIAFCDLSKCSFRCKLGYADCDGNPANGCEVSTGSDSNHCGHCGNICPLRPNAMGASCMNGQCVNSCNMGFGDCDLNPFNGCEADLSSSVAACGACGKPCLNRNAIATCSKGLCNLQCNPGFVDCNMDGKDGCEAKILEDPMNCGACGNACPQNNPFCTKGMCGQTPPYPAPCTQDKDVSGSFYVICAMNGQGAWITANNGAGGGCNYAALKICQQYNFTRVTRWGGTCGTICGYCGAWTCQNPQGQFALGAGYTTFDGGGGNPAGGANISCTVHWECAP